MRKHAGAKSALIDRVAIGDAIPSSSLAVSLPDRYTPDAAFLLSSTGGGVMIEPPDRRLLLSA